MTRLPAPFWWIHPVASAYETIKTVQAFVMAAAIFPAYLLARLLVTPGWALFAAVGTLLGPAGILYAFVYTAVAGGVLALVDPFGGVVVLDRGADRSARGNSRDRRNDARRSRAVAVLEVARDGEPGRTVEQLDVRGHLVQRHVPVAAAEREREARARRRERPEPEGGEHAGRVDRLGVQVGPVGRMRRLSEGADLVCDRHEQSSPDMGCTGCLRVEVGPRAP